MAEQGYYDMTHHEPLRGIPQKEAHFFEPENIKTTLCGHLFKLSEFVVSNSEE